MSAFAISLAFLMLGGQPPADTGAAAPAVEAPKPEPKMVCRYESITGSRVQKQKICRPEGQSSNDMETTLQRELARHGDMRVPGEMGGGVSPRSGVGN